MHRVEVTGMGWLRSRCTRRGALPGLTHPRAWAPAGDWSAERHGYPDCTHCPVDDPAPAGPDQLAPGATVTVPEGGGPVTVGVGGPVVGTVTSAAVVAGRVEVSGTIDGRAFGGVADWPGRGGVEPDWSDVDDVRRRPLPLPEGWRW